MQSADMPDAGPMRILLMIPIQWAFMADTTAALQQFVIGCVSAHNTKLTGSPPDAKR